MIKANEPILPLGYHLADDGTYTARLIVSGLLTEEQARAACDHMQKLFCGEEVTLNG